MADREGYHQKFNEFEDFGSANRNFDYFQKSIKISGVTEYQILRI
jgi:hypothetical protein